MTSEAERLVPARVHRAAAVLLFSAVAPLAHAGEWRSGEELYNKVCGHCHKPSVGVGTVLEGRELPLEYLKIIVRNGLMAMPAFPESHVDDEALAAVGAYLAGLPVPAATAPEPEGGKP